MVGKIRIANRSSDLQASIRRCFDRVQRQMINVDHSGRRFHVQFHQIEQGRAAGDKPNVGALLRRIGLRGVRHAAAAPAGRINSKVFIVAPPRRLTFVRTC